MKLKIFINMLIAALVVFIVFNLFVPMSVTVVNEGFTEGASEDAPIADQNMPPPPIPPASPEQGNMVTPPEMAGYPAPSSGKAPATQQQANQRRMPPSAPQQQATQMPTHIIQPSPLD